MLQFSAYHQAPAWQRSVRPPFLSRLLIALAQHALCYFACRLGQQPCDDAGAAGRRRRNPPGGAQAVERRKRVVQCCRTPRIKNSKLACRMSTNNSRPLHKGAEDVARRARCLRTHKRPGLSSCRAHGGCLFPQPPCISNTGEAPRRVRYELEHSTVAPWYCPFICNAARVCASVLACFLETNRDPCSVEDVLLVACLYLETNKFNPLNCRVNEPGRSC